MFPQSALTYIHIDEKSLTDTAVTFMGVQFLKDSFTYGCEELKRVTGEVQRLNESDDGWH